MAASRPERRLAAVLVADVVGYARLMGRDEAGTLARLKACRRELIEPLLAEHRGRIVNFPGDNALCEFASVVDAVECAFAVQRGMAEREREAAEPDRLRFRIGVNLGDVLAEEGDVYGDGVNVAARLEQLCEPGGVAVSGTAYDHLRGGVACALEYLGERRLRNIDRPVRVYRAALTGPAELATSDAPAAGPLDGSRRAGGVPHLDVLSDALLAAAAEETGRCGRAYAGFYRMFRQAFRNNGNVVLEAVWIWVEGDGLEIMWSIGHYAMWGRLYVLQRQLYCVAESTLRSDELTFLVLNGTAGRPARALDGIMLGVALDHGRTPSAMRVVLDRVADESGDAQADRERWRDLRREAQAALHQRTGRDLLPPHLAGAVDNSVGQLRADGSIDWLLRVPFERSVTGADLDLRTPHARAPARANGHAS